MYFRMKRDTPLQELIDVYSKRYDIYNFRFLFNGQGINPKLTAIQVIKFLHAALAIYIPILQLMSCINKYIYIHIYAVWNERWG